MPSSVRSFFRNDRSRNKTVNLPQVSEETVSELQPTDKVSVDEDPLSSHFLLHDVDQSLTNHNVSCCGGDEKKTALKNQADVSPMTKETVGHARALADPMEPNDYKIEHVVPQRGAKVGINDGLKDLFGKKEITKAMINQLAQRASIGPMNSTNDDPPRLCTKKHVRDYYDQIRSYFSDYAVFIC